MADQLPEGYCLWELEDTAFRIGILGTGPGFLSMLDIIHNEAIGEFLPLMELVAVCEPDPDRGKLRDPRVSRLPVYDTWQRMLAGHPEINLLIELAGKRHKIKQIVAHLPDGVILIEHTASFFLCALNKFAALSARCQLHLDNQRLLLQAIIDEIPEDILLLDTSGRVVDANRNVALGHGVPKEELIGRTCWDLRAPRGANPHCGPESEQCPFTKALRTGRKAEALETRVSREGRLLYLREYAYPILDGQSNLTHVMIMRRDITSRTEHEKRAQQSEKVTVVERLSAYMAHEIRNPLFAIAGFANSLLKSPTMGDTEREKVRIILEETARLDGVLKEMIGFSRTGAEMPGEVDALAIVSQAVETMRSDFLPRTVQVAFRGRENLPKVTAHADTLRRAVMHLMSNASEAMGGAGHMEVSVGLSGPMVVIEVRDAGAGMSKEMLERVFSPFFTTKDKGYGLDLALIRKSVEDWGGLVEIHSREGSGTEVMVRLAPVLAATESACTQSPDV